MVDGDLASPLMVSDEWHLETDLALRHFPEHAVEDGELIRPATENRPRRLADAHFHRGNNCITRRPPRSGTVMPRRIWETLAGHAVGAERDRGSSPDRRHYGWRPLKVASQDGDHDHLDHAQRIRPVHLG